MFPQAVIDREISGYLRFNIGNIVISEVMASLAKSELEEVRNNWGLTSSNLEDVFLAVVNKFDRQEEAEEASILFSE